MVCRSLLVAAAVVVVVMVAEVESDDSQYCTYQPDDSEPSRQPEVPLQYTVRTEYTQAEIEEVNGFEFRLVYYREWIYDAIGNRIALNIYQQLYHSHTVILDWNRKQQVDMYVYKEGETNGCFVSDIKDATYLFPMLYGAGQDISPDRMPDPGVPLGIINWNETHYKGEFVERGIASERWDWCGLVQFEEELKTTMVSMATHWSVPEWNMPIPTDQVTSIPLSYKIVKWGDDVNSYNDLIINSVLYFEPFIADFSPFIIPRDMYCEHLVPETDQPFPDYFQDTFFSFSLEYRDTGTEFFMWADAWYDFGKKLYRIDHDLDFEPTATTTATTSRASRASKASRATKDSSTITTTTLLLDYNDGVSFEFVPGTFDECIVSLVNATQGDWASLTGLDHLWADSPNAFFGSDVTNYTYYGERVERYMVVGDWRGLRYDWPPVSEDEKDDWVWQWRFTNKNVSTVSSLGDHVIVERQVPVGVRINPYNTVDGRTRTLKSTVAYSIYDFEVDAVGKDVEFNGVRIFDAYDCYSANWRDHLRFKLDVTSWPEVVWTPLLTSTFLNGHWQVTLAMSGKVSPIRITRVQTIIEEEDEAWVEFVLLYRHYRIGELDPDLYRNMTTGEQARGYLTEAVNNGDIKYEGEKPDGGSFTILALHGSLSLVVEPECTTTTSTTTTSTTTTTSEPASSPATGSVTTTTTTTTTTHRPGDSTTTPPQNSLTTSTGEPSTSTEETRPPKPNAMYTPGDLAGLGVGMLLMGFALGASGTFLVVVKHVHHTVMGWCMKK